MSNHSDFLERQIVRPDNPSQWVVGVDKGLKIAKNRSRLSLECGPGTIETCLANNSFWLIYNFHNGLKLGLRTCLDPQGLDGATTIRSDETSAEFDIRGSIGRFEVSFDLVRGAVPILHYVTTFQPAHDLLIEALPRDVCILDRDFRPLKTSGAVYVQQAGPTAGLVWFSVVTPKPATILYFQNLTSLSTYAEAAHAEPSGSVAANWPELGLSLPRGEKPLKAGTRIVISDAYLTLADTLPQSELEVAERFLADMAAVYGLIAKPPTTFYDWPLASRRTLTVLSRSKECGRRIKGHFYLNAYLGSSEKPPESMVHLAVLVPLLEYEKWRRSPVKVAKNLRSSLPTFFDPRLKTIVRWLPGQKFGEEADSEEERHDRMDSWYFLHTLLNLARIAELGDEEAMRLLLPSLKYAIKVAQEFEYEWPVFYDPKTLRVVKAETKRGEGGEHDVPGLYTHVMLQAFDLTKDARYLEEAERAARHLQAWGFKLLYQTNNTMMTAIALARLSKVTSNRLYADLGLICMANVIARLWIWNSAYGFGKSYDTFLGVAPLQDAEYIASYEEHEFYAAAMTYLQEAGSSIHPALNVLLAEYCKYLLHRGRFYFCGELPKEAIAEKCKEGALRPDLFIPLEDLRTGWAKSGQVGQEVYGASAALILTSHAFVRRKGLPFIVHAEYPIMQFDFIRTQQGGRASLKLCGGAEHSCRLVVLAEKQPLPRIRVNNVVDEQEEMIKPTKRTRQQAEFVVAGGGTYRMDWSVARTRQRRP